MSDMGFWLSIVFGICLVIMLRREAKYVEIAEKTIIVMQKIQDVNLKHQKELVELIENKLPHLMPQVNEILGRKQKNDSQAD